MAPLGYLEGGVRLPGTLKDSKRALCKRTVSLYGSSVRRTGTGGSFSVNAESYVRHVKVGFGNGAPLSLERLREGNLEGRLLY